jgi:hypothetical protein
MRDVLVVEGLQERGTTNHLTSSPRAVLVPPFRTAAGALRLLRLLQHGKSSDAEGYGAYSTVSPLERSGCRRPQEDVGGRSPRSQTGAAFPSIAVSDSRKGRAARAQAPGTAGSPASGGRTPRFLNSGSPDRQGIADASRRFVQPVGLARVTAPRSVSFLTLWSVVSSMCRCEAISRTGPGRFHSGAGFPLCMRGRNNRRA